MFSLVKFSQCPRQVLELIPHPSEPRNYYLRSNYNNPALRQIHITLTLLKIRKVTSLRP